MDILVIMGLGILVGNKFFLKQHKKINERMQITCTVLLIFSMGIMLGKRENFLQELSTLGVQSFIYFIIPTIFSVIFVYFLSKYFMERKKEGE